MTMLIAPRFAGRIGRGLMHLEVSARRYLTESVAPVLQSIELRDGIFGTGFAIAWYGGYHLSKAWSFVAAGLTIMLIAILVMKSSEDE